MEKKSSWQCKGFHRFVSSNGFFRSDLFQIPISLKKVSVWPKNTPETWQAGNFQAWKKKCISHWKWSYSIAMLVLPEGNLLSDLKSAPSYGVVLVRLVHPPPRCGWTVRFLSNVPKWWREDQWNEYIHANLWTSKPWKMKVLGYMGHKPLKTKAVGSHGMWSTVPFSTSLFLLT